MYSTHANYFTSQGQLAKLGPCQWHSMSIIVHPWLHDCVYPRNGLLVVRKLLLFLV